MTKHTTPARQSWLDDAKKTPLIDEYAQQLTTFVAAMADGKIEDRELAEQEQRLAAVMREVEPQLSDAQHGLVTKLLCELTAYNIMNTLQSLQSVRPQTKFRG